ncbi:MAG: prepilin-type N-terminal cleavage/methylation domain-containing protein [Burkholderiales bacterium]
MLLTFGTGAQRGFTLAEAVIVIVILGIVSAAVAVFIRGPIDAYFDVSRRAELSDVADTALRRIARDLQRALPNSVRVSGGCSGTLPCYLEYVPVVAGGRYRAEPDQSGAGDVLDFANNSDTSFDLIGPNLSLPSTMPLWLVVYNLGIPGADVYSGAGATSDVRRPYAGGGGSVSAISFTSASALPFESPARRFHIVSEPVTYVCLPAPAGGTLMRYSGYGFSPAQPVPPGGIGALLASGVTVCSFTYSSLEVARSAGLVSVSLQIGSDGETLSLFNQVHVSNVP